MVKKVLKSEIKEVKKEKKTLKKSEVKAVPAIEKLISPARYFEAKGGRKTAVARVRLSAKKSGVLINNKDYKDYFRDAHLQKEVMKPFEVMNLESQFGVEVHVSGGGINGQAEAVRHGISRALILINPEFRKRLSKAGFLTRDNRMVERKKYGLRKARRAPQWAKR